MLWGMFRKLHVRRIVYTVEPQSYLGFTSPATPDSLDHSPYLILYPTNTLIQK